VNAAHLCPVHRPYFSHTNTGRASLAWPSEQANTGSTPVQDDMQKQAHEKYSSSARWYIRIGFIFQWVELYLFGRDSVKRLDGSSANFASKERECHEQGMARRKSGFPAQGQEFHENLPVFLHHSQGESSPGE